MTDIQLNSSTSMDTSPLTPDQLSDNELKTILLIEHQLRIKQTENSEGTKSKKRYLAPVQVRSPNVLLLDGARGTGKTSLLLTMAHRWNAYSNCGVQRHAQNPNQYRKRIKRLQCQHPELDGDLPTQLHPLRILDFDPIPPQMSLISGIIHAWQPLVEQYDKLARTPIDCDPEDDTLEDRWEKLFRVATVGWSPVPAARGLLEQVLDRQEQVRDWQNVGHRWYEFVTEVVRRGRQLRDLHRLACAPIFVIMIDDVDLQVERIREVLPALRLLYHPNVAFLVAAHWEHLIDTLKIDFLGKQNRLANRGPRENALAEADADKWAGTLAFSAATKVFPRKNRWTLQKLSLLELLKFPESSVSANDTETPEQQTRSTMWMILNECPRMKSAYQSENTKLGNYLLEIAKCKYEIPAFITYRDAHQIFERSSMLRNGGARAIEAVRLLISDSQMEAVTLDETDDMEVRIEYRRGGELAALFPSEYVRAISEFSEIVFGARPQFIYLKSPLSGAITTPEYDGPEINFTSTMLAIAIQDRGFGVATPSLQWNVRLALAWTRVRVKDDDSFLSLSFHWRFHRHPNPFQLLEWGRAWQKFVRDVQSSGEDIPERMAYGWVYYQLKWHDAKLESRRCPLETRSGENWNKLFDELVDVEPSDERAGYGEPEARSQDWRTQSLPLLARPEVGLPPEVQCKLLKFVVSESDQQKKLRQKEWLTDQRRRLITDAIIAAGDESGRREANPENTARVERMVATLENRYAADYKRASPWSKLIELSSPSDR